MEFLSILVVDDVPEARMLLTKILNKHEFCTLEASSGEEAVRLIEADKSISLVLLDIMLPDMDGYEVMDRIREFKNNRGFKVCFVSGMKEKDAVLRAISLGGDDYLVKPIYPDVLIQKVKSMLGLKSAEAQYNSVKCAFPCHLVASKVLPDMQVLELSETDILIRSSAGVLGDTQIEMGSKKLSYYLKHEGSFTLKVGKCERESYGKYLLRCRFVGLAESVRKAIRALTVKGKRLE